MTQPSSSTVDTVTTALRDAAYVGIGLGVIAFQQAQVRRQELTRTAKARHAELTEAAKARMDATRGSFGALGGREMP